MKDIFIKFAIVLTIIFSIYSCEKEEAIIDHEIFIYGDIESWCTSSLIQECTDSSYNFSFYDISVDSVYQESLWNVVFKYDLLGDKNTVGIPVVEVVVGLEGYGLVNPEIAEIYKLIKP